VVNVPHRGIGAATVEKIRASARKAGTSMFEAARQAGGKLSGFVELVDGFARRSTEITASRLAAEVLDVTGYMEMLKFSTDPSAGDRIDNIGELLTGMEEFEEAADGGETTILAFLEKASLTASSDQRTGTDGKVALMTLHSAKGLEFPVVFITGCEEGLFPHARTFDDPDELEEERRLMYVGMTRAMKKLFVTHAMRRRWQGQYRDQMVSRFVRELPETEKKRQPGGDIYRGDDEGGFGAGWNRDAGRRDRGDEEAGWGRHEPRGRQVDRGDGTRIAYNEPVHFQAEPSWGMTPKKAGMAGKKVRHEIFGSGTVKGADGEGDSRKLLVYFPGAGLKKILERFLTWE
jgi:DNA helicase-2/ATP-dependent DNA helicase PcrA